MAILLSALFFALYLTFASRAYLGVDGALRCLEVYFRGQKYHGNNHMLYPFWIAAWARLVGLLGFHASDAFQFMRISQAMNAFFGAASIGFVYYLIDSVGGRRGALLGTLLFAFSGALTLHATNSAEVLPGLFFGLLALVVLAQGIQGSRPWPMVLAGGLMAVALASYQAVGTVAAAATLMCCFWPSKPDRKRISFAGNMLFVAAGGLIGVCLVYGLAYADQGIPVSRMLHRFLILDGQPGVYGGFSISKAVNVPMGLIQDVFTAVPPDYMGLRALLHHSHRIMWIIVILSALAMWMVILFLTLRAWRQSAHPVKALTVLIAPIAFILFPLAYWGPTYDKLWLFPLACLGFAVGLATRDGLLPAAQQRVLMILLTLCISAEAAVNVPRMIFAHVRPTPHLEEARAFSATVGPNDWVVLDFDEISQLWLAIWGQRSHTLLLPSSNLADASQWFAQAKSACRQGQGRIAFVGVLDHTPDTWNAFLGANIGIPFEFLDEFRMRSLPLLSFDNGGKHSVIRVFTPH